MAFRSWHDVKEGETSNETLVWLPVVLLLNGTHHLSVSYTLWEGTLPM